ncbi:MAG: hypothetical protein GY904_18975 [Planctomycetaceae bacterium]|nr:hypothetical protein [Planctomycetaceae bacterium]
MSLALVVLAVIVYVGLQQTSPLRPGSKIVAQEHVSQDRKSAKANSESVATPTPSIETSTLPASDEVVTQEDEPAQDELETTVKPAASDDRLSTETLSIFTEDRNVTEAIELVSPNTPKPQIGDRAACYLWHNLSKRPGEPVEGQECWSLKASADDWFGLGVYLGTPRDLSAYETGFLNFHIKTTSPSPFKVGVESVSSGESWVPLTNEKAEFGFARDGNWHKVRVPMSKFNTADFEKIQQPFIFAGQPFTSEVEFSIDDVWWEAGNEPAETPLQKGLSVTRAPSQSKEFQSADSGESDSPELPLPPDMPAANSVVQKPAANPVAQNPAATVQSPVGDRPKSSVALIATDPKLKSWLKTIPSAEIREYVTASIDLLLQDEKKSRQIIAVGKFDIPKETITLWHGVPAGGILMHQEKRLDVRFNRFNYNYQTATYNRSARGTARVTGSHWPWFVTTLEPGDEAQVQALTLQHQRATIKVPVTNTRFSVVLPTIKLQPLGKKDSITLTATVSDADQLIPASIELGLPGFTGERYTLSRSTPNGKIELPVPHAVFDFGDNALSLRFINAFHETAARQLKATDLAEDKADLGNFMLKPRQSNMGSVVFTNTNLLSEGASLRLHCDLSRVYANVNPSETFYVARSGNSLNASFSPMTHFIDLGTDFQPKLAKRPVESWLNIDDLLPGSRFTATPGHTYLVKCREPQQPTDPRWGLVRFEPATNAFDNFVLTGESFGKGFRQLAHRLGRYRTTGLRVWDPSGVPTLFITSALDDDDAKVLTNLVGKVSLTLSGESNLSVKGLNQISRSPAVTTMQFANWNIRGEHLQALEQSRLTSLKFDTCQMLSNFPVLRFQTLNGVDAENCTVDGRFVAAFAGCHALSNVSFDNCVGLRGQEAFFQNLPGNLTQLRLEDCQINPQLKSAFLRQRGTGLYVHIQDQ